MAKFKLKRKTFGVGALFGVNNFKAMSSGIKNIAGGGTKQLNMGQRVGEAAKGVLKFGGSTLGVGAVGAGVLANKAGGGDLLSGGEKSAKEMDF